MPINDLAMTKSFSGIEVRKDASLRVAFEGTEACEFLLLELWISESTYQFMRGMVLALKILI